jgi:hypothetical protein
MEIIGNQFLSEVQEKEELDKKYVQLNGESEELQAAEFPQGSTGAIFKTVLAAERFVPKFALSKIRKRGRNAENDEKMDGRGERQVEASRIQATGRVLEMVETCFKSFLHLLLLQFRQ